VSSSTETLPPAINGIHAKVHTKTKRTRGHEYLHGRLYNVVRIQQKFTLDLTFTVVRPVTIGLEAIHKGSVVGSTGLRSFAPTHGELVLKLTRAKWPTSLVFLTDTPKVTLADPGPNLTGTVNLSATASAIAGRRIAQVSFQYSPAGANIWLPIGTASAAPFAVPFDTTTVANGAYDLRAIATDSNGTSAISAVVSGRRVQN
jgi:hypothetical protein